MATVKKVKKAQNGLDSLQKKNLSILDKEMEKQQVAKAKTKDMAKPTPISSGMMRKRRMKSGGKVTKAKTGKQMIKRADGSYSQRGLWDNIRAAKGSGKKPTSAMLKQEKKIKAKSKK